MADPPLRSITRARPSRYADVKVPIGEMPEPCATEAMLDPDFEYDARPPAPKPVVRLSVTEIYRKRTITISAEGMTLDAFCDMLDKRLGVPS